ncbi:MAG: hypothetical protein QNJ75_02865 [Acidimicrobiia bacterium]|nr:hypothetical protein [Acidimicrobiia bacterium]
MKKFEAKIIALIFVALITVPVIVFAIGMRPEPNQNRPPTPLPEITVEGILDRELTPQLDQYLEDSLIIAPTAVAAEAWTDVAIGDNPNPEVTIGTNGWLYYTLSLDRPCLTSAELDTVVDSLSRATAIVAATGRDLVFAVAPDKATIIPDFLPDDDTCVDENALALAALDSPDNLITVWDEMSTARANERPIYFRLDTHWTNEGAGIMAEAIVERLTPGGWSDEVITETATVEHEGDLTVLLGLPATEESTDLDVVIPGSEHTRATRPLLTAAGTEYDSVVAVDFTATAPVVTGRSLVMHDSYGWALTPMLAPYFEQAAFIAETNPAGGHMWNDLEAATTIIHVSVQRSVHDIVLGRDLAADFLAAFADSFQSSEQGTRETGERLELDTADGVYVVVEMAAGQETAEVAYNDVTAKLNADSPRAAYYVGPGGTMYFAGVVDYRVIEISS